VASLAIIHVRNILLRYHEFMRSDLITDSLAATSRWIVLLGLSLVLLANGLFTVTLVVIIGLAAILAAAFSLVGSSDRPRPGLRILSLIVDFVIAFVLFYITRTLLGPLVWAVLLPIVAAAWTLAFLPNLLVAIAATLGFALLAIVDTPIAEIPARMVGPGLLIIATSIVIGLMARQMKKRKNQGNEIGLAQPKETGLTEQDRIKTIYEVASSLNSSLVFDKVLEHSLDLAVSAIGEANETVSSAVGGILLLDEGGLRVAAARRLAAADIGRILPARNSALADMLKDGEPRVVGHPARDPEFNLISGLQNCQSLYCTPLRFGLDLFGVMFLAHPQENFFTQGRRDLIDVVARQVMGALKNAQLYEELNEEKERMAGIQENARRQLERSLHDGPTQSVAAIAMRANLARRLLTKDPTAAGEELFKLEVLARRTTKEMQHLLFTLHPRSLEASGVIAALKDLAQQTEEAYDQKVEIDADPNGVKGMDLGKQAILFYIAAEAINNARLHAQAKAIRVKLSKGERDTTLLEISDDGIGFTQQQAAIKKETDGSLGLDTLRERVELINGAIQLDSSQGKGTKITILAPLNAQAAEQLRRGEL
jgi:signal transduction histidine kinase